MGFLVTPLLVGAVVAACAAVRLPNTPEKACAEEASAIDGTVVGAFATTVGAIRRFEAAPIGQQRWPKLADGYPAALCYIDGDIRRAVGGGDNAFDRAAIGVVDGDGQVVVAGFRDRLPVRAP